MKLFYTHQAIYDLKRLRAFIAKENPLAAEKISKRLTQAITRLTEFPFLGKSVNKNVNTSSLRDLVTGSYIVRYTILKQEIHVLRLWHSKEDWSRKQNKQASYPLVEESVN